MWEIENGAQAITFAISIVTGIGFSVLYDVFKVGRLCSRPGTFVVALGDFLYFVICTLVTFCLLMLRTLGQPRVYVFIAFIIGFLIWRFTLSRLFLLVLKRIFGLCSLIFSLVHRAFRRFFARIAGFFVDIIKKFTQTAKKGLKGIKRLVYNHSTKKKKLKIREDINGKKS